MGNRKKKENAAKKHKNFKLEEVREDDNFEGTVPEEISAGSIEPEETEGTQEDLLEKERLHAKNMEERFLRVNAEFENYKKRIIKENSERFKYFNLDLIKDSIIRLFADSSRQHLCRIINS